MIINIKGYDVLIDNEVAPIILPYKWRVRHISKSGMPYFSTKIKDRKWKYRDVQLHRLIMGEPRGKLVNHHSRNTLDNRKKNLRIYTSFGNNRNSVHKPGLTGFRNVVFDPKCKKKPYRTGIRIKKVWIWRLLK